MKILPLLPVVGLALGAMAPATSGAQGRWVLTPSLTLSEQFDDNIFGTSLNRESDFISQTTPGISLAYQGESLEFLGQFSATGQIYAKNPDLNNFGDNQQGTLIVSYRPEQRLTLGLFGYYAKTNTPTTFLNQPMVPVGVTVVPTVDLVRQESTQYTLNATVGYQFNPRVSGTATYSLAVSDQESGGNSMSNAGSLRLSYEWTRQDQLSLTATGSVLSGSETDTTTTFSLPVGWSRQWTRDLSTNLAVGPQVTDGNLGPTASASLGYQLQRELSVRVAYSYGTG
ncbi:MAG: hypothetical protein ACREQL_04860, partial [Candidatus Binatia bacterium]